MKVLLSGGQGFVGTWLQAHLRECGDTPIAPSLDEWDITNAKQTVDIIEGASPDVIIHLAALTDVQYSWSHPGEALRLNVVGTQNVLQGALALPVNARPRVVMVSSAEVYGTVALDELPITETLPYRPVSPYAATKAAAEMLGLGAWYGSGLEVIIPRSFNHIGPNQAGAFLVAALARRICRCCEERTVVDTCGKPRAQERLCRRSRCRSRVSPSRAQGEPRHCLQTSAPVCPSAFRRSLISC